jgi:hypothetical protein
VDRDAIFEAWAPRHGLWTPWAQPILFAHVDAVEGTRLVPKPTWVRRELLRAPGEVATYRSTANGGSTAVVVDLAGVEGVAVGLALADIGFRPVPLYNALPSPESVVPMYDVVRAIIAGAEVLTERPPAPQAPPAFLLDARRAGPGRLPRAGQFDNRSLAFETDFPSATTLRKAGVVDVVLIQSGRDTPAPDLERTLAIWQDAGISIRRLRADDPRVATRFVVRRASLLGRFLRFVRRAMLRGDRRKGFGAVVPHGG